MNLENIGIPPITKVTCPTSLMFGPGISLVDSNGTLMQLWSEDKAIKRDRTFSKEHFVGFSIEEKAWRSEFFELILAHPPGLPA